MQRNVLKQERTFHWTGCALLLLLVVIAFSPWLIKGRVLAPLDIVSQIFVPWRGDRVHPAVHNHFVTDAVLQYVPYRMLMHESFRQDGYVGWNPLIFGGTAQHANTMLVNHEVTMHLHRFVDFWTAWNLGRLIQFIVAGLGMLVFLHSLGSPKGIALFGAVAYMFNHQFVAWIYFNQVVATFCWMPWVFWALYRARDNGPGFVGLAAGFICLALLGATLQQAAFVIAALGCLWTGWMWEKRTDWASAARCTAVVAVPALLGAGIAAFALEPGISAFLENGRAGHGRGDFSYDAGWLQPLWHALASPMTAYPFLFGSVQSIDLWKIFKFDIFNVGFFGTVPMLLATIAFFSRRVSLPAKLLMLVGVIVPLTPLVGFLYHRFNVLWILGGCWAAAAWLTQSGDDDISRFTKIVSLVAGFCGALWLLVSVALWLFSSAVEPWLQSVILSKASQSAYGIFTDWIKQRTSNLVDYLLIWNPWQLLALSGLLLSLWGLARIRSGKLISFAAAFGVAMQLSVFWWQWTTWSDPQMPYGTSSLEKVLRGSVGTSGRIAMKQRPWAEYIFPPNTLMPAGIAVTGGYDAMHPDGMRSQSGREWDFPGTTHYLGRVSEESPDGWPTVWSESEWCLWENPGPASGIIFQSGRSNALAPDDVRRPTFNTMEISIPAGATAAEIFSNWHRGWRWKEKEDDAWKKVSIGDNRTIRIDFQETLPEEKTVLLRYDPTPPLWVLCMSLISLATSLIFVLFAFIRKTRIKRFFHPIAV